MTAKQIRNELERLLVQLVQAKIALTMNAVVLRTVVDGQRVTWNSPKPSPGIMGAKFGTIKEYLFLIDAQMYSAILYDGSLLQLSYDFDESELIRHRLLYYPCPFDVDPFLFNDAPILDVLDLYCSEGVEAVRLRSPLRFDYDIKSQRDFHPASHFTFVSESCRWAVAFPLSPGHFTRFIFHHFYPVHWRKFRFIRNWPQQQRERTITAHEEKLLHIASAS